ncbi:hypothetical protein FRC16_003276 [Serendipita sp. 398]|nr:hypothetical protein FRC16_003276 [Serendipita sp. 398]
MQRLLPLELSSIFFATRDVPRPITRYFHSLVNTDRIVYPTRLSLDGQQPIINHSAEDATFSRRIDPPTPGFSDHELKAIYRDLLRLDIETPDISFDKRIPDPAVVIPRLTRRLVSSSPKSLDEDIMSLSAKLKTRLSPIASQYPIEYHSEGKPYSAVLNALHTNSLIAPLPLLGIDMPVSLDIMKPLEWASLVDACVCVFLFHPTIQYSLEI